MQDPPSRSGKGEPRGRMSHPLADAAMVASDRPNLPDPVPH